MTLEIRWYEWPLAVVCAIWALTAFYGAGLILWLLRKLGRRS